MTIVSPVVSARIAGCLLAGALAFQLGPTTTGRAVDQINGMSSRPLPSAGANPVPSSPRSVWVPDHYVRLPGEPAPVLVPGHWAHRLPDGNLALPPVTVERPSDGTYQTLPGTTRQLP